MFTYGRKSDVIGEGQRNLLSSLLLPLLHAPVSIMVFGIMLYIQQTAAT